MPVDSKPASPSRLAPARRGPPSETPLGPFRRQSDIKRAGHRLRPCDSRPPPVEPREERPRPSATGLPERDRGVSLMVTFVTATLVMVVVVAVTGAVDRFWVLVPVMLVDFAVTFTVLASITRLLHDDGDPPA